MSIRNRVWATIGDHADVAQLVERDLAKVEVAGSSPVVRSRVSASRSSRPGCVRFGELSLEEREMRRVVDLCVYPLRERLS
jgi:hypothetical protein